MDVINDRIVDVGLNVLGYLIAGGLGVLMHTTVLQWRVRRAGAPVADAVTESPQTRPAAGDPGRNIEFVNFGAESPTDRAVLESETTTPSESNHRNRREIIRLAREMLQAGTAGEQIKRTLPITQSELALLKNTSSN